jgi:hypothetical protein
MRHLGHCSAHLIISLSLRLLAAICLAAGKCCPGYRHRKSSKQLNIFSIFAVNTKFSQGAVQECPASILGL